MTPLQVVEDMHGYAMSKDDFEYVLDVTKFKSKAEWAVDPYKGVPTKVKSAFTRRAWHHPGSYARLIAFVNICLRTVQTAQAQ